MDWKAITYKISGVKCDTPLCTYREDGVQSKDYPQWLGRPCPKCGANLLTVKDYKMTKRIHLFIGVLNVVLVPITVLYALKLFITGKKDVPVAMRVSKERGQYHIKELPKEDPACQQ